MSDIQRTDFMYLISTIVSTIQLNSAVVLGLVAALIAALARRYSRSPWRKLPPGPRGWPFLGNALSLSGNQWLTFNEWKNTYGDVVYLSALGQPMIVLNTQEAARELLDRRAGIYSDRPNNIVAAGVLCGGLAIFFQSYGPLWRKMRKATHEALNRGITGPFQPAQLREAVVLTCDMLTQPTTWRSHLQRASSSMVMSVTYDTPPMEAEDDPIVKDVNEFSEHILRSAVPGAHLVEVFTWMKYIPSRFAKWKRDAEEAHANFSRVFEDLYNSVGTKLANGINRPSFSASLLKDAGHNQLSVRENAWLAATMYLAGAETTSTALEWWMLGIVAYPETQRRAQTELDAVVGRTRIPTFADLPHLPYLYAMVKEALRWGTLGPLGLPHRSTRDDWYQGMFIPAGTICIPNLWAMHRDPEIYGADAHHFNPARFLDKEGQLKDAREEGHLMYGFGRRVCVGRHVANDSLFIDMAVMLWACTLEPAKDEGGEVVSIDVDGRIDVGLNVRPVPFSCSATPRFQEAPSILAGERELFQEH
ncbi:cytochrome P450 [Artomyces pyxidatus]|uniref:Cytochrome P450 n=1 Tax=Artomyces pyxidatus TaxID=48021 RepID=A0ACB8TEV2_9AGAM|nr:cytochrome P450 [Artomyces pyxidatus]